MYHWDPVGANLGTTQGGGGSVQSKPTNAPSLTLKKQRAPKSVSFIVTMKVIWLVVEPTHLKHISQIGSSSPNRDENKKCLKPPPI